MRRGSTTQRSILQFAIIVMVAALVVTMDGSPKVSASPFRQTSPTLGAALSYSILGGSIVTNTGPTTMPGDLGVSPGIGPLPHVSGFPPGIVGPPGTIHDADANAAAAQAANTAAFTFIDQPCTQTFAGVQDLTLLSPLGPGVYCALGSFSLSGNLTLNGSGVWIFKTASTLITSPGSSVTGGDPCNVWWRVVSSATLDTTTRFIGNILALTDINLLTGAELNGRALAQTGQVVLDSNTITGSVCLVPPPPPPPPPPGATDTPRPTDTPTPTPTPTPNAHTDTDTDPNPGSPTVDRLSACC
jgi:hypothetical protein